MNFSGQKSSANFDKVIVTNIQDASGIFIGNNYMIDWSSFTKSNSGFGSLRGATLTNAINVVCDQDINDMTIENQKYVILEEGGNIPQQQSDIDFQSIHVNAVNNGSAINLGDNKQLVWGTSRKINYGTGKSIGTNQLNKIANFVLDNDIVDSIFQTDEKIIENIENSTKNIRISQKNDDVDKYDSQ
ncbi:hypothetical protein [Paenibacillus sp. N3.4]|uniref:hypothetical protein n=1 Tax=Paenibacillus sp. N3.4 TaxID=2603222 RepID=UPI0011CBC22B|nr:hypothetical protein [Paenibacillus sp. N3.4]TXK85069.1 hypothetical protein FU659_06130 [Paenibacillus sp. N3.4]